MVFVPLKNIGLLLRKAREDDVNETDFIVRVDDAERPARRG